MSQENRHHDLVNVSDYMGARKVGPGAMPIGHDISTTVFGIWSPHYDDDDDDDDDDADDDDADDDDDDDDDENEDANTLLTRRVGTESLISSTWLI